MTELNVQLLSSHGKDCDSAFIEVPWYMPGNMTSGPILMAHCNGTGCYAIAALSKSELCDAIARVFESEAM